ncbi:hypothetical protein IT570_10485 [Candidatus Sumerlaeota bacterium]|nr:hypothetical protein [Candidatus Sumerlaeota bacterium]
MSQYPPQTSKPVPSCSAAFERAMDWTKTILFPFKVERWLMFAVSLWVTMLGEGGGFPTGNFGGGGNSGGGAELHEATNWMEQHMAMVILIVLAIALVIILISALVNWLSSRAEFMFIDGVVTGVPSIGASWSAHKEQGNSLFLFRFAVACAYILVVLLIALSALPFIVAAVNSGKSADAIMASGAVVLIIGTLVLVPLFIIVALLLMLINDFVPLIMFRKRLKFLPAFRIFQALLNDNKGTIAFYLLVRVLLALGIGLLAGFATMLFGCLTCCIGFLPVFVAIPSLPFAVLRRSFNIFYLEQFGPQWEIFNRLPPPPTNPPAPMMGNPTMPFPSAPGF